MKQERQLGLADKKDIQKQRESSRVPRKKDWQKKGGFYDFE